MRKLVLIFLCCAVVSLSAQDFGFGDDEESGGAVDGGGGFVVSIGGEVYAKLNGFVDDFSEGAGNIRLGDMVSGKLNFTAENSSAKGVVNLNITPGLVYYNEQSPVYVDEAYVTGYFGRLDVTGGLRKLTWGKADSMGPMDVVNPLDFSDLSGLSDPMSLKIARPLVHASFVLGQFAKLQAVFVPTFEPVRFSKTGRWAMPLALLPSPDTTALDYAQAGVRFTTTIQNAADIGVQYYYGRLTTLAALKMFAPLPPSSEMKPVPYAAAYNPYHQIGLDYAQVIAGFNIRAEFAANITEDISGDDVNVQNPHLAWSLGFDRELFAGITMNVQCTETVRLLDDKVSDPLDVESGNGVTGTRIFGALSKSFLRDELTLRAAVMWDVEAGACLVMPSIKWAKNDVEVEIAGGIFAGSTKGLFGQFHDNSFIKAGLKYTF